MTPTEFEQMKQRLLDPTETFTADEVNGYVEWVERNALTDSYNQARIADALSKSASTSAAMVASLTTLETLFDNYQPPIINVIGGINNE